jgi:hypothetical protein
VVYPIDRPAREHYASSSRGANKPEDQALVLVDAAETGVVVNGRNVTATGSFPNEPPYDAPNHAAWQHDGVLGWAGYRVAYSVNTHTLWDAGSHIDTNIRPIIQATRGFGRPVTPGVRLCDILAVQLGTGTLDHVVNDTGDPVSPAAVGIPGFEVSFWSARGFGRGRSPRRGRRTGASGVEAS